ncbi:MAG: hypothetical protein Q9169_006618 [Polycauliona sp. 2 TL-2023]
MSDSKIDPREAFQEAIRITLAQSTHAQGLPRIPTEHRGPLAHMCETYGHEIISRYEGPIRLEIQRLCAALSGQVATPWSPPWYQAKNAIPAALFFAFALMLLLVLVVLGVQKHLALFERLRPVAPPPQTPTRAAKFPSLPATLSRSPFRVDPKFLKTPAPSSRKSVRSKACTPDGPRRSPRLTHSTGKSPTDKAQQSAEHPSPSSVVSPSRPKTTARRLAPTSF